MEDTHIVELYWARCEEAIAETSKKYGKYCYSIAFRILGNTEDANESVNDTYLAAWETIPPHRPTILSTFLGKITRRIAIQIWRKTNTAKRGSGEMVLVWDELSDCIPSRQTVEDTIEAAELAEELNTFLQTLGEIERDIFVGRYWSFLSIAQMSIVTGFGESKIKMMLLRTRKKLRAHLRRKGFIYG